MKTRIFGPMWHHFAKVQVSAYSFRWQPALLGLFLWLLASCAGAPKLNQRNGRYYSAREMARLKAAERSRKTKSTVRTPTARRKTVVKTRPAAPLSRDVASVIQTARSYQGTPYKYGGTTRLGMDCSGLLCASFQAIQVQIPRSSNEQALWGDPVRPQDMRPGDLVFFGASPGSSTITHVGLITEVTPEGVQFIHSSSSLGVVENSLESDYYLSRFIKAVRPKLQ